MARNQVDLLAVAHERVGPYRVQDIEFVVGVDVEPKVGRSLSEAIFEEPYCTSRYTDIPQLVFRLSFDLTLVGE